VSFSNDWLYAAGAADPLYDFAIIKFRVQFTAPGTYDNDQASSTTAQLPLILRSDDPAIDDASDCSTAGTSNCNDGITGNDDPTSVTVQDAMADIEVTKTTSDLTPAEQSNYSYTLKATNNGPDPATNVVITDPLSASLTHISHSGDGTFTPGTGVWEVGSLAIGQSKTLLHTVKANLGTQGQTINNTATLTSLDQTDSLSSNDSDSISVTVQAPSANAADLNVVKLLS
jgi:uncharacterized repeat protein (TIGR01451 family)